MFIPDDRYFRSQGAPLPSLRRFQYSGSPEEVESHLPEECIKRVFDHLGKPCPVCTVVQMA